MLTAGTYTQPGTTRPAASWREVRHMPVSAVVTPGDMPEAIAMLKGNE